MAAHLNQEERQKGNRCNGKTYKVVRGAAGEFSLFTPRDRSGSFEPQIVSKRQMATSEELEEKVIPLYGMGMSFHDIAAHIKEMYAMGISAATLSLITEEPVYPLVWLDCMHQKVKDEGETCAVYNILALNRQGRKSWSACTSPKTREPASDYRSRLISSTGV